jgi:hypothetical protein
MMAVATPPFGPSEIQAEIAGAQRQHLTVGDQRNGEQTDRCRLDDRSSICRVRVLDAPNLSNANFFSMVEGV